MNWKRKTMRGCSPFTRASTNYRKFSIVCQKMVQPYQTMMSTYATRRWRICLKSAEGHWANTEAMAHCLTMCSVAKFYTSEVRLSRHWNGSTTASTWWMVADKPIYIFGGSEIYRLPYIHLLQNNSAPMDRNKNSIQKGYQCKNPFVCCLFYLYLHFRQSFISVAVCISEYRHWKGKGFRAEYSPQEEDSARNGLPPRPFNFQMKSVLPLQTSKGKGRMTESVNSYIADLW